MTPYQPVTYRSHVRPLLGQTFDEILGLPPMGGDLLRFLGHGIGAWFGVYIGTRGDMSMLLRGVGWVMGAGMGVAAILDLVSVGKRIAGTHPPEPSEVHS